MWFGFGACKINNFLSTFIYAAENQKYLRILAWACIFKESEHNIFVHYTEFV